ncbi:MAG: DNA repair protein RecO [Candidatus Promineifilaceae bacterium]
MARERTFRSEAIVLRRSNFGEADRLLTLYSHDFGKLRALAKGARKPQTRKTGHVELFMRTNFLFARGREIDIITQAELVEAYAGLRADLVRATYAAYVAELLDAFTVEGERDARKYRLLAAALAWYATGDNYLLAARHFELRLLALAGYQPQLFHCVRCGRSVADGEEARFSPELGGILCPDCAPADRAARPLSAAALKALRQLQTRSWESLLGLQLRRSLHTELEGLMHDYLRYLLERNLRSAEFLQRLRREAAMLAAGS